VARPMRNAFCLSTVLRPPAEVAAAAPGGARWLQIYVFRDREVSDDVISQALSLASALVLTADLGLRDSASRSAHRFRAPEDAVPAIVAARDAEVGGGASFAGTARVGAGVGLRHGLRAVEGPIIVKDS
jgi:(S)-2-hydroxy-acid oxidase